MYTLPRIGRWEEPALKTARVFKSGRSQAVRLPKEFRFAEDEAYIKKAANAVLLLPTRDSWHTLVRSLRNSPRTSSWSANSQEHKDAGGCPIGFRRETKETALTTLASLEGGLTYCRTGNSL